MGGDSNKCIFRWTDSVTYTPPGGSPTTCEFSCNYGSYNYGECTNDEQRISFQTTFTENPQLCISSITGTSRGVQAQADRTGCVAGSIVFQCGAPSLILPFFSTFQFIIATISIIIIYAIIIKKSSDF